MKKKLFSLQFVILLSFTTITPWTYIPFDIAMKKNSFGNMDEITERIVGIKGNALYSFFQKLYEKNCNLKPQLEIKIPKIIHQIWIGSDLPKAFQPLQQSWIHYHLNRGWSYKLWTDAEVTQLKLYNQELYDASDNPGIKADILRYELLYHFGGVYADMDYECLAPLDELHYTYDFYTGLQPLDSSFIQLGNALIASRSGHPILEHCIKTIKDDWHLQGAPKKTGPVHFTKSFYLCADKDNNSDIAFPAFYFCPLGCREYIDQREEWQKQGAFAIHWWAKSWMPKEYRPAFSRNIHNDTITQSWND